MRMTALAIFAVGSVSAAVPAHAQTYGGGGSARRGHGGGSLNLGIGHGSIRQYRSEHSACRSQDEFVFGSQRDHEGVLVNLI